MNFSGSNRGTCGCQYPIAMPTYQQYNQVVQTCNVEEIPHYVDYHTHVVNNCLKKHINIPTYSTSYENVWINEYPQASSIGMPFMPYLQPNIDPMYNMKDQYQGNVGTNHFGTYGMPSCQNVNIPFGY